MVKAKSFKFIYSSAFKYIQYLYWSQIWSDPQTIWSCCCRHVIYPTIKKPQHQVYDLLSKFHPTNQINTSIILNIVHPHPLESIWAIQIICILTLSWNRQAINMKTSDIVIQDSGGKAISFQSFYILWDPLFYCCGSNMN